MLFRSSLVRRWSDAGYLPNLKRLREAGSETTLTKDKSMDGGVWLSVATGLPAEEHGLYSFFQWDAGRMRIARPSQDDLYLSPFWLSLQTKGIRTLVFDVPHSFRPVAQAGIEIVGYGAHDRLAGPSSWPRNLISELTRKFGPYPYREDGTGQRLPDDIRRLHDRLLDGLQRKVEAAHHLLVTQPWDFA